MEYKYRTSRSYRFCLTNYTESWHISWWSPGLDGVSQDDASPNHQWDNARWLSACQTPQLQFVSRSRRVTRTLSNHISCRLHYTGQLTAAKHASAQSNHIGFTVLHGYQPSARRSRGFILFHSLFTTCRQQKAFLQFSYDVSLERAWC